MATQITVVSELFSRFELSVKEETAGQLLNEFQKMYFHNMRADLAQAKLNLLFTPENAFNYAQQEACLTGQIDLLSQILDFQPEVSDDNQPTEE